MDDWENMLHFAIEMIKQAKRSYAPDHIDERIAIVSLDHATELLMKSFLLKMDYFINEIDTDMIKKGIDRKTQLKNLLNENKTISFMDALNLVCKLTDLDSSDKDVIVRFHKLRNEIQHKGMYLNLNETEKIGNFCPSLQILYDKMFPKYSDVFPKLNFH